MPGFCESVLFNIIPYLKKETLVDRGIWFIFGWISFVIILLSWITVQRYNPRPTEDINFLSIEVRSANIKNILTSIEYKIEKKYQVKLPPVELSLNLYSSGETSYGFLFVSKEAIHVDLSWKLFLILNDQEISALIIHELGHINLKSLSDDPLYYYHYETRDIKEEVKADSFVAQFVDSKIISSAIIKLSPSGIEQEKRDRLFSLNKGIDTK